jgi:hypothetical protein
MLEELFKVFGDECPDRLLVGATKANTVTPQRIIKKYKRWANFEKAYKEFCISQRNTESKKVIEKGKTDESKKELSSKVTK